MRVLVTGGAGFIGSHIARYHLNKGDDVYVIDNLSSSTEAGIADLMDNPNFKFIKDDIITSKDLNKLVMWPDLIYHMAAVVGIFRVLEEPHCVLAVNIAGCERLLRAIQSNEWKPRVIIASSSEVYGPNYDKPLVEDSNLIIESGGRNRWHYAVSKLADESFGLAYFRKFGIPITLIRFFNTIGPGQTGRYGMVVPRFIEQALSHQPITVFGDGKQSRSFCDVRDTVQILDAIAQNPKCVGEIINVGNDQEISINELAELIKKLAKSNSEIKHLDYEEAYGEEFVDIQRRRPDLTKLQSFVPLNFEWTLEDTINNIIELIKNK